jgi:molybdopterin molybdotransferase
VKLLAVEEARARILAAAPAPRAERVNAADLDGRVLAEDVFSGRNQPPFNASAMDGWAVRSADTPGALTIVGESAAGHPYPRELGPGQVVRIFTGAPVPAGADAIVIQEDARREGETVVVPAVDAATHVRPVGQDFRAGERLLSRGDRLDPWRLSLLAAAGRASAPAARRPHVAIISTGEEIVAPGTPAADHQIYNSGAPALAALVARAGGSVMAVKSVGDDLAATTAVIRDLGADLIVTLGGASVGDYDLVKPALAPLGLEMRVESVAVRPGKPTWFGILADGRRVLGLPGNPASALVCAELFLRPFLSACQGAAAEPRVIQARTAIDLGANGPREHWMRARLSSDADGCLWAEPFRDQDSSLVSVFAQADALLRRPPHASAVPRGGAVDVLPLMRA